MNQPAGIPVYGGPALLRMPPPDTPQLQNVAPWTAQPILVSGATAYRDGEFLYQDYIHDDHGAANGVRGGQHRAQTGVSGSYTYPTDAEMFAYNAADLVEFRVKRLSDETLFRVTLNTMPLDPDRVGFTIALGASEQPVDYPFSANVHGPAEYFITVHGTTGILTDAGGNTVGNLTVAADAYHYQFTVSVPHSQWDPEQSAVSMAIGVGLWNTASNQYLIPQPLDADESNPGGAGPLQNPPAFFNVGFRDEPYDGASNPYFEAAQANGLAEGDMAIFSTEVDFAKLAEGMNDESDVPTTGPIARIFGSHFTLCPLESEEPESSDSSDPTDVSLTDQLAPVNAAPCPPGERGRGFAGGGIAIHQLGELQPYIVQVPEYQGKPYGMALVLHGGGQPYTEQINSSLALDLMARSTGSVVLTPQQRGPSSESRGVGMADVFEAWADVARWYPLDPTWNVMSGISQGGHGLLRLAATWPDLFARIFTIVGVMDNEKIRSLRHVELTAWNAAADELVEATKVQSMADRLAEAGYRFEVRFFTAEHLTLALFGNFSTAVDWLGEHRPPENPRRVTYTIDPTEAMPEVGMENGHAYWLSGMSTRDEGMGFVDAVRHNSGLGQPPASDVQYGAGYEDGGTLTPILGYASQSMTWLEPESEEISDTLDLDLTNVATVTVEMQRTGLSCDAEVHIISDGPATVNLADCDRTIEFSTISGI